MPNMTIGELFRTYCTGENHLSSSSTYYWARGNTSTDLNSEILEALYKGVLKEEGAEAAKSYVHFVYALGKSGDVSASTFIDEICRLARCDWNYRLSVDEEITVRPSKGESASWIVGKFLQDHASELPKGIPPIDDKNRFRV